MADSADISTLARQVLSVEAALAANPGASLRELTADHWAGLIKRLISRLHPPGNKRRSLRIAANSRLVIECHGLKSVVETVNVSQMGIGIRGRLPHATVGSVARILEIRDGAAVQALTIPCRTVWLRHAAAEPWDVAGLHFLYGSGLEWRTSFENWYKHLYRRLLLRLANGAPVPG